MARVVTISRSFARGFSAGDVIFTGSVFIGDVNRAEGTSLQLQAETDVENGTLLFAVVEVTEGQGPFVSLNSSGYLIIKPNAMEGIFFIDVSHFIYIQGRKGSV